MSGLDLIVIHPNSSDEVYQGLRSDLTAIEPPLWARLIAGYIIDEGFSVEIIDAEAENLKAEEVAARVAAKKPPLVAIVVFGHQPSASTQMMPAARRLSFALHAAYPECVSVAIGGHISALPESSFNYLETTYACKGEGPATVLGLLSCLKGKPDAEIKDVPGLVWSAGAGHLKVNKEAALIDIAKLRGNVWYMLPMHRYRAHNWQCFGELNKRQPYASIYTSLNCPYRCSFCCISAPFNGNVYRMRDAEQVLTEIRHLYNVFGVKTFKIVDEMFVLNQRHVRYICDGLKDIGHDLNIWAYARVDTIKPAMLRHMREAGIKWLALGIESGSAAVRDQSRKALKSDSIEDIVKQIRKAGINVIGNFIFGLPGDTYASMQQTLKLALDLKCDFANFYSAMAYPGSALYKQAVADGLELPLDWSGYSQHSFDCLPLATASLSSKDIIEFRDAAFKLYYTDPSYLEMVKDKFGEDTLKHIADMTKHSLRRQLLEPKPFFALSLKNDQTLYAYSASELAERAEKASCNTEDARVLYFHSQPGIPEQIITEVRRAFPAGCGVHMLHGRDIVFAPPGATIEA